MIEIVSVVGIVGEIHQRTLHLNVSAWSFSLCGVGVGSVYTVVFVP
jgi:hypothetical protein